MIDWIRKIVPLSLWTAGAIMLTAEVSADENQRHAGSALSMISHPSLSADGKTMLFCWLGDLWTADTDTGEASPVATHPAREAHPRFTPDGSRIVFSSDRTGSYQVFSMPSRGGEVTQHTFHSEGNLLEDISPDGTRALVRGFRDKSGIRNERMMIIDLQRDTREVMIFDAAGHSAQWSADGKRLLFCRGGESFYRKGYRGSRAAQIWEYDIDGRKFTPLVREESESLWPLWLPDGGGFYHVSGADGVFNLWLRKSGKPPRRLTSYTDDGVVTPAISADGSTIAFRRGFGVMIFHPGKDHAPRPLELWTKEKLPDDASLRRTFKGCDAVDFTSSLQPVFSLAGDLWWMESPDDNPVRITSTAEAEESPGFSPDGKWLYFLRDDGMDARFFRARLVDSGLQDERPVTSGGRTKSQFSPSPDGSKIAWVEGTGDVFVAEADGGNPRRVLKGWSKPTYDWSPDGRWLAIAAEDRNSNRDIQLVRSSGEASAINLTRHPAFEGSPRWSPDGRWLVFSARRSTSGKLEFWRIDFGKDGLPDSLTADDAARLGERAVVISTKGIEPTRPIWSPNSREIWFHSRKTTNPALYAVTVREGKLRTVVRRRGVPVRHAPNGALIWRVNRDPEIFDESDRTTYPISIEVTRPRQEALTLGFRRIWRTIGERFYDPSMNGADWQKLRLKYEPAAVGARDSHQFYRVIRQLLGELNASHLSFHRRPWPGENEPRRMKDRTAHPGLRFDDHAPLDGPLIIRDVIPGSPVAGLPDAPIPGDVITRIAGDPVTNRTPLHVYFNGSENRNLPVTLRDAAGQTRVIELRCIPYREARSLDRQRQRNAARDAVAAANPKAAYISVPNMNLETCQKLAVSIYRASLEADGLILDFRNNGGGREADRMLGMLCQPVHSHTIPRDGPKGYPVERLPAPLWDKPLVVLCNQDTYSNAEIFCHAIKQSGRAPLVGTATAGGVISAVSRTIPGIGKVQVPFRGWFLAETGLNLDLNGAQPDHQVHVSPDDESSGRDPQLDKAIEVLSKQL